MKELFHPSRITAARWSDVLISQQSVGVIAAGGEADGTCRYATLPNENDKDIANNSGISSLVLNTVALLYYYTQGIKEIYGIAFFALKVI